MVYTPSNQSKRIQMKSAVLFVIPFIAALTGCFPRHSPSHIGLAEIKMIGEQICFGKNEYQSNIDKYKYLSITLNILRRERNPKPGEVREENIAHVTLNTADLLDIQCLSPWALNEYELNKRYVVYMDYLNTPSSNSLWGFMANFCLYRSENDELELFQINWSDDYHTICSIQ